MSIPQAEIDYQLSHPDEFSAEGLSAFILVGMSVVTVAVALRIWARHIARVSLKADDYILCVALVILLGAQTCQLVCIYIGGFGHHSLTLTDEQFRHNGKASWAWSILYTTGYPLSRISLVLLYRRVFVQQWFRAACWFLVFCFGAYAISTMITDFTSALPVNSIWNRNVKATISDIDDNKLYIANSGFNIATDAILLILPLIIIWRMQMTWLHKLGLSGIFCLGALTLIASIMRLYYYYKVNVYDGAFAYSTVNWWTMAEVNLGLLCPCLVTFRPLIRAGFMIFSSRLSPAARERVERSFGVSSVHQPTEAGKSEYGAHGSSTTEVNSSEPSSLRSKPSQLEAGTYTHNGKLSSMPGQAITTENNNGTTPYSSVQPPSTTQQTPRDGHGLALNQEAALANLDPRAQAVDIGDGTTQKMGTSTNATVEDRDESPPGQGIGVSRDWKLEKE